MQWVKFAVNNIRKGKIRRLSNVEERPGGTFSIAQGRTSEGDPAAGISPEKLPGRPSTDESLAEMIADIETLLRFKERAYPVRLVDLFRSMLAGTTAGQQRATFGDRLARLGRQIIIQNIEEYGRALPIRKGCWLSSGTGHHQGSPLVDQADPSVLPVTIDLMTSAASTVAKMSPKAPNAIGGRYCSLKLSTRPCSALPGS
jgi:hypothetical protein